MTKITIPTTRISDLDQQMLFRITPYLPFLISDQGTQQKMATDRMPLAISRSWMALNRQQKQLQKHKRPKSKLLSQQLRAQKVLSCLVYDMKAKKSEIVWCHLSFPALPIFVCPFLHFRPKNKAKDGDRQKATGNQQTMDDTQQTTETITKTQKTKK